MLSDEEGREIREASYIPEHNYLYVSGISDLEPKFFRPYLTYESTESLLIIGYPINGEFDERRIKGLMEENKRRGRRNFSIISPSMISGYSASNSDFYYILELENLKITQKTRNMIKRAKREVYVQASNVIGDEHKELIEEFVRERSLDERTVWILRRIESYVLKSDEVMIINGRDESGRLIAFNIVDLFSKDYAFFMFSIRRKDGYVPGTSDLLFYEMANLAMKQGKRFLNLGLGINDGVRFFKEKWGGRPFLPYYFYDLRKPSLLFFLSRIIGA